MSAPRVTAPTCALERLASLHAPADLGPLALEVLCFLLRSMGRTTLQTWYGQAAIATRLRRSERAVRDALAQLEAHGLIHRLKRNRATGRLTDLTTVLVALELERRWREERVARAAARAARRPPRARAARPPPWPPRARAARRGGSTRPREAPRCPRISRPSCWLSHRANRHSVPRKVPPGSLPLRGQRDPVETSSSPGPLTRSSSRYRPTMRRRSSRPRTFDERSAPPRAHGGARPAPCSSPGPRPNKGARSASCWGRGARPCSAAREHRPAGPPLVVHGALRSLRGAARPRERLRLASRPRRDGGLVRPGRLPAIGGSVDVRHCQWRRAGLGAPEGGHELSAQALSGCARLAIGTADTPSVAALYIERPFGVRRRASRRLLTRARTCVRAVATPDEGSAGRSSTTRHRRRGSAGRSSALATG